MKLAALLLRVIKAEVSVRKRVGGGPCRFRVFVVGVGILHLSSAVCSGKARKDPAVS